MTIQATTQLTEDVFERLKSLADASGKSPSDFISEAVIEHIEDLEDAERAEEILKKVQAGAMKTYSLDEVSRELGLED